MSSPLSFVRGQWTTLPYPDADCGGRVVIVTGANCGLGLEAARHFVRLGAATVVLGCRSVARGEAARRDIEAAQRPPRPGVVDVWELDLASAASVAAFAARAAALPRLDVLVNNAGLYTADWALLDDGHETMVMVNVVATFLLTLQLLPVLRQTGVRFNVTPRVAIVSSGAAAMAFFPERTAERVFEALKAKRNFAERYNTTKLLQLMLMRRLAAAVSASGGHVVVNALNPGLCKTQLFRRVGWPLSWLLWLAVALLARDAEMGSRTLMAAALAGDDTHGQCMSDCKLAAWPAVMRGDAGAALMDRLWHELVAIVDAMEPGIVARAL